jgi:glycine cleavage system regulatory protein
METAMVGAPGRRLRYLTCPAIPPTGTLAPQIAINIQLHLPETENAEVYEKLFKALRDHLLSARE